MIEAKKKKELLSQETKAEKKIEVLETTAASATAVVGREGEIASGMDRSSVRASKSKWLRNGKMVKNVLMLAKAKKRSESMKNLGVVVVGGGGVPPAWVVDKLEGIETMLKNIEKLKGSGGGGGVDGGSSGYQDPQDIMLLPSQSSKLVIKEDLNAVEKIRLDQAGDVLKILGMGDSLKLQVATSLPRNGAGLTARNAFRNSCHFDQQSHALYLHSDRVKSGGGDLTLLLVHAVSHIKVSGGSVENWDDSGQAFVSEFYRNFRVVAGELITRGGGGGGGRGGGFDIGKSTRSISDVDFDLGGGGGSGGENVKEDEYFTRDRLAERMKKYAVGISGGGDMIEKWSRGGVGGVGGGEKKKHEDALDLSDDEGKE